MVTCPKLNRQTHLPVQNLSDRNDDPAFYSLPGHYPKFSRVFLVTPSLTSTSGPELIAYKTSLTPTNTLISFLSATKTASHHKSGILSDLLR